MNSEGSERSIRVQAINISFVFCQEVAKLVLMAFTSGRSLRWRTLIGNAPSLRDAYTIANEYIDP